MHHLAKVSLFVILAILPAVSFSAAAKKDYFTEDELDLIREAQEISARVPVYFKLAERRLIFLGLMEKSAEQIEKERKEKEKRAKEQKKGLDTRANANKAPIDDTSYLDNFSPAELLRGYTQALDEVTTNIDDAYSRKLDVRDSLEDLAKFVRETQPILEKFKPKNDSERAAIEEAIEKAKQTAADTKEALSIVPKTEKKRKP
jgi:Xaa-Pro aminopeptidase